MACYKPLVLNPLLFNSYAPEPLAVGYYPDVQPTLIIYVLIEDPKKKMLLTKSNN